MATNKSEVRTRRWSAPPVPGSIVSQSSLDPPAGTLQLITGRIRISTAGTPRAAAAVASEEDETHQLVASVADA